MVGKYVSWAVRQHLFEEAHSCGDWSANIKYLESRSWNAPDAPAGRRRCHPGARRFLATRVSKARSPRSATRGNAIPYLGICLGLQAAVVEFARHVAGFPEANSTQFRRDTPDPVIALITERKTSMAANRRGMKPPSLVGSMRLGAQECQLTPYWPRRSYGHMKVLEAAPPSRWSTTGMLNDEARWPASGCRRPGPGGRTRGSSPSARQFHPDFMSIRKGHPLFTGFHQRRTRLRRTRVAGRRPGMKLLDFEVGLDQQLFLIAGPCVAQGRRATCRLPELQAISQQPIFH